ncbi:MAG: CHAT domain-containing protein [Flammeovirgaceae bacterium]|nr:CHAT domain-containing protein [Flammeovirgaceae bacterium]
MSLLSQDYDQYNVTFGRDTNFTRLVYNKTAYNEDIDTIIKYGEILTSNISKVNHVDMYFITNMVLGWINKTQNKLNSKNSYAYILYRNLEERNGNFGFNAGNDIFRDFIVSHNYTLKTLKSFKPSDYSLKSYCALIELYNRQNIPGHRFVTMYIADSLIQFDSTPYSSQALQNYYKIRTYHCQIGQWYCQNKSDTVHWYVPIDIKYTPIEVDVSIDVMTQLFSYNGDWVELPLLLELPFYFDNISVSSNMLGLNTKQKTNLLIDMLKQIDICQNEHKKVLLHARESVVNHRNIRRQARKKGKFGNDLYDVITSDNYVDYFDKALDIYYSNYKIQFLNQAFVRFTAQGLFDLALFPGDSLARLDSVHDSYLSLFKENSVNPISLSGFVDRIIDTTTYSEVFNHNVRLSAKKLNSSFINTVSNSVKKFIEQQIIINIYAGRQFEAKYLDNVDKVISSLIKGLTLNKGSYEKLSISRNSDLAIAIEAVLLNMKELERLSLGRDINLTSSELESKENFMYLIQGDNNTTTYLLYLEDSVYVDMVVFPTEIMNYEVGSIEGMITYLNSSLKEGIILPYALFANSLFYSLPNSSSSPILVFPTGDFNRINWTIITDYFIGAGRNVAFHHAVSHSPKDFSRRIDMTTLTVISNLDYNIGTSKLSTQRFGQFRGTSVENYWSTLNGTRDESNVIKMHFKVANVVEGQVTKSELSKYLEGSNILHIATHASYDPTLPADLSAFIVLDSANYYTLNHPDLVSSALFTTGDVRMLKKVNCDLIVLSACNSGNGRALTRTVSVSLPSVLAAKGANFVLASHWEISDSGIIQFFDYFYEELKRSGQVAPAFFNTRYRLKSDGVAPSIVYSFDLIVN